MGLQTNSFVWEILLADTLKRRGKKKKKCFKLICQNLPNYMHNHGIYTPIQILSKSHIVHIEVLLLWRSKAFISCCCWESFLRENNFCRGSARAQISTKHSGKCKTKSNLKCIAPVEEWWCSRKNGQLTAPKINAHMALIWFLPPRENMMFLKDSCSRCSIFRVYSCLIPSIPRLGSRSTVNLTRK